MANNDTYTFDEIYTIEPIEGISEVKSALKQVEFTVASVRARGGHLIKFVHDGTLGRAQDRVRMEVRRFLRAQKKEKHILLMISGEEFSMTDDATRYLSDKCPRVELDPDLDRRNGDITIVYL